MSELLKIVSSQYKHLPNRGSNFIDKRVITNGSMLKNESFSFQALYRSDKAFYEPISIGVETELPIKAWRVDYVAVSHIPKSKNVDEYESTEPGIFPDMLNPRPSVPEIVIAKNRRLKDTYFENGVSATLNAVPDEFQSVWFTVNPDCIHLNSGEYKIKDDASTIFDEANICLRAGHHCAQLLTKWLGVNGTLRGSFYIYNDYKDVDKFIEKIKECVDFFKQFEV